MAIGIALDTTYSRLVGLLPEAAWRRVLRLFSTIGFSLYTSELSQYLDQGDDPRCILQGLNEFREHLGGQLTIMLLKDIGHGIEVHALDEKIIKESIGFLKRIQKTAWQGESLGSSRLVRA